MSTTAPPYERIDLRTSAEIKALIVRATATAGVSISAFLISSAQERAKQVLADALYRCHRLAGEIGMVGAIVDAKHEKAKAYYQRFEFESLPDAPLTLWLPTTAIATLCGDKPR